MFVGKFDHSLDQKGRVVLPSSFRAAVVEKGFVSQQDDCLALWTEDGFKLISDRWTSLYSSGAISKQVLRKLTASVSEVKLDAAGRITLPRPQLDELGFESKVVITGALDRIEIWPEAAYIADQHSEDVEEEFAKAFKTLNL